MQIQWEIDWLGLDNDPYQQIIYLYWYKNYTKTIYGMIFRVFSIPYWETTVLIEVGGHE